MKKYRIVKVSKGLATWWEIQKRHKFFFWLWYFYDGDHYSLEKAQIRLGILEMPELPETREVVE